MKKVIIIIIILLLVLGICAGIYLKNLKDASSVSGDNISITSGEAEKVVLNTQERYNAFYKVLKDYYYDKKWPDGAEVDSFEIKTSGDDLDTFAIFDIDEDGKDELIIRHTDTSMAGMIMAIYDYDDTKGELVDEYVGSVFTTFYKNGIIKTDASHNQGRAFEFMWPHGFEKYDADKDTYVQFAWIDGWDKQFYEYFPAYIESGEEFPVEIDKDGNGGVYSIFETGKEDRYVDDAEYEEWVKENFGELESMIVPFMSFSEENINNTINQ